LDTLAVVFSGGFVGGIIIHADHETWLKAGRIRSTQVYYNMIKPSAAHSKGDGFPGQGFSDPLAAYPANDASIFHGRTRSQLRHRQTYGAKPPQGGIGCYRRRTAVALGDYGTRMTTTQSSNFITTRRKEKMP